ncbi:hypothetical protein HMPREF1544_00758 [Mucor circinelloides 1006PhL]|uniref:Uncharacterized protein n=1 Tax=Mucor circinelloides f. circinelloides (strain 1006PhL) TaxID=1220926 RepID=S2KJ57_MUCC1|nr:hypothetical protein HMPREF1544_00758 [Mucor circinelloides 1006PhL]
MKELRAAVKEAWFEASGKKVAPSWKKVFERERNRQDDMYGIVEWPENITRPHTGSNVRYKIDTDSLSTENSKTIRGGFQY